MMQFRVKSHGFQTAHFASGYRGKYLKNLSYEI